MQQIFLLFMYQLLSVFCIVYFIFLLPEIIFNSFKTTLPSELLKAYIHLRFAAKQWHCVTSIAYITKQQQNPTGQSKFRSGKTVDSQIR
jgi:hypothetical protein